MKIKRKPQGEVMVLELSGKIMGGPDYENFHSEVKALIKEGYVDIVLNFTGVPWVNSNGVGLLIGAYHILKRHGGRMTICGLKSRVLSILYVTQLHRVFEVYDTYKEAAASLLERRQSIA